MLDNKEMMKLISVITGDKIRASITKSLEEKDALSYSELKKEIQRLEKEKISDGRLNWHLKQLESNQIIKKTTSGYVLTDRGNKAITLILNAFKSYKEG